MDSNVPRSTSVYCSIGSDEIRLLQPVSAPNPRDLSFRMVTMRRDRPESYTAVSYTWGDDDATERIKVNGHGIRVRPNLWSCLYYLSLYAKSADWTHLWVGAICIDQSNEMERNAQVRFMDQIYRKATCVSVWLGLAPVPEHCVLDQPQKALTLDVDPFDWTDSMADLANRPYWSRCWVVQEFLLGQQVQLYCSGNRIDWEDFKTSFGFAVDLNLFDDSIHEAMPLAMGRHPDRHPEMQQPLHELLVLLRRSKCKDQRDRVFALLGLIPLDERQMLERYFPDYTMSEDDVITVALAHV